MIGCLARAKAGHDKGDWYIIIEETKEYVLLADGRYRTMTHPKRKNKKHIQLCKRTDMALEEIGRRLKAGEMVRDEEIKRAIKLLSDREVEE
jgi:hypothetical protein